MTDTIDTADAEIARLQAEIAAITAMQPTVAERFAVVESQMREAEQVFRNYGMNPGAAHPGETAHLQRLAVIGACMVIDPDKLMKSEHQRIAAQGEGISAADKARRLEELRRQILRTAARRELALREIERPGEFLPRPTVHPDFVVRPRGYLEQIVNEARPS